MGDVSSFGRSYIVQSLFAIVSSRRTALGMGGNRFLAIWTDGIMKCMEMHLPQNRRWYTYHVDESIWSATAEVTLLLRLSATCNSARLNRASPLSLSDSSFTPGGDSAESSDFSAAALWPNRSNTSALRIRAAGSLGSSAALANFKAVDLLRLDRARDISSGARKESTPQNDEIPTLQRLDC
nr:hypothetical protein Iba_chr02fCG3380 [Ipomoea batatas]